MNKRLFFSILVSLMIPLSVVFLLMSGISQGSPLFVVIETGIIILLPATPLVYGWCTGDTTGAVITGILPIVFLAILMASLDPSDLSTPGRTGQMLVFFLPLVLIGGLTGFLASRQKSQWLFLAVCCMAGWVWYFLVAGIN